jgi:hypothetical protein
MVDLRDKIAKRLDEMLYAGQAGRGPMWGGPEAYELQVLLLLEFLFCPDDHHSIMTRYSQFFGPRHPTKGCRVLSAIVSDHQVLASEFRAFKEHLERDLVADVASRGHE